MVTNIGFEAEMFTAEFDWDNELCVDTFTCRYYNIDHVTAITA